MLENDPFNPLDAPINMERVDLRTSSLVVQEQVFLYGNGVVMFGCWVLCAWAIGSQPKLAVLFLFFAGASTLCTYVPLNFLRAWRNVATAYHETGQVKHLKAMGANGLSVPTFAITLWMVYTLMMLLFGFIKGEVMALDVLWMVPGFLLGPLQMVYFFRLTHLYDKVLDYHKVRR